MLNFTSASIFLMKSLTLPSEVIRLQVVVGQSAVFGFVIFTLAQPLFVELQPVLSEVKSIR